MRPFTYIVLIRSKVGTPRGGPRTPRTPPGSAPGSCIEEQAFLPAGIRSGVASLRDRIALVWQTEHRRHCPSFGDASCCDGL